MVLHIRQSNTRIYHSCLGLATGSNKFSLGSIHYLNEVLFQRCPSNKTAINVRTGCKLSAVAGTHRATIQDSGGLSHSRGHIGRQPTSQCQVHLLSLLRSGSLAGANRPNWLIGNYHLAPVRHILGNCCQLAEADLISNPCLSFLKFLPNAREDVQSGFQSKLNLVPNKLISLSKNIPPLRVAQDHPTSTAVLNHSWSQFSSEGSLGRLVAILGSNANSLGQFVRHILKIATRHAYNHLAIWIKGSCSKPRADCVNLCFCSVHFPVATNKELSTHLGSLVEVNQAIKAFVPFI